MSKFLTLVDLASRDANGKLMPIVETLAQSNPILKDMPQVECNDKSGYKSVIRTGLPTVAWRKMNYGVKQSKSETQQVRDACGELSGYSEVDMSLLKLAKDKAEFLKGEVDAFMESMAQEWAKAILYGDTSTDPEKFNGFMTRYCSLSKGETKKNVLSAASAKAANTSVLLVGWSPDKVHGIYPEGSTAGIEHEDQGNSRVTDKDNGKYQAYVNHFTLKPGLTVRDWRYVVRICNIDPTDINAQELIKLMVKAKRLIPNLAACKPVFYAHREVVTALEIAYMDKSNVTLSLKEAQEGLDELRASRIPIHECDAFRLDEPLVK